MHFFHIKNKHRLETRFRLTNLILFVVVSVVMLVVMTATVRNITRKVSSDYARLYSSRAIGTLNTHLNREIALINKAVNSEAIVNWFSDEFNEEKRAIAYREMKSYIDVLYSANLYFGIAESKNEFSVQSDTSYQDFLPYDILAEERYTDQWYFECAASDNDYVLNVDIDKLLQRKLVWLNHKVVSPSGEFLGVFCSGLKFDRVIEELFDDYDDNSVWGLVIDEHGIVQMDSSIAGNSDRLIYDNDRHIQEYYQDPVFDRVIQQHLDGIDGFFGTVMNPDVYELNGGSYSFFSVAPIESTNWSVITFYNADSLFGPSELIPLYVLMLICVVIYLVVISLLSHHTIFLPFRRMMGSLAEQSTGIYGLEREDEIGDMARTIEDMKDRLDRYNAEITAAMKQTEKASKAKGDFLANMSHEIRTPLNTVIGMAQIAKKTDDLPRIRDCIGKIENASTHLLSVINDVLDMSKIEAGKLQFEMVTFNLENNLRNTIDVLAPQLEKKHLHFNFYYDPQLPALVVSDRLRLAQVVANLLSNAIKFTAESGSVTMEVKRVHHDNEEWVEVAVIDDGIGMTTEQMQRLFQNFEQADSGTSRKYGGTGLGLAITRRIVEMLGGSIQVASEPDQGSRFWFIIPLITAEVSEMTENEEIALPDDTVVDLSGKRLLVAEDIEINREILAALLAETGVILCFAENGQQAVETIEQDTEGFDLIFMDVQMPVMDGYEATRRIRAIPRPGVRDIPIYAMTANVFNEDIEKCLAAGMNGHIGKPISYEEVIKVLLQALV